MTTRIPATACWLKYEWQADQYYFSFYVRPEIIGLELDENRMPYNREQAMTRVRMLANVMYSRPCYYQA